MGSIHLVEAGAESFAPGMQAQGTHNAWSLTLMLKGEMEICEASSWLRMGENVISLTEPGYKSSWRIPKACTNCQVTWFVWQPPLHWQALLGGWQDRFGGSRLDLSGQPVLRHVRQALLRAYRFSRSPYANRHDLTLNAIETALLLCQSLAPAERSVDEPRIRTAIGWLRRHLEQPVTLEDVMQAACLSRSRLCELFRRETGLTVMAFLEEERMQRAANLLSMTKRPIKEIARLCGFGDAGYFTRRFAGRYGISPKGFRHRKKGGSRKQG